jgi:hypothetical protein
MQVKDMYRVRVSVECLHSRSMLDAQGSEPGIRRLRVCDSLVFGRPLMADVKMSWRARYRKSARASSRLTHRRS